MASKHVICRFGTHCLGPGLASCSSLAESCAHNAVLLIQTKKPLQANGFQMIALEAKTEKQQAEPRAALQVSGHLLSCWKIYLDKYVQRKPKRFCFSPTACMIYHCCVCMVIYHKAAHGLLSDQGNVYTSFCSPAAFLVPLVVFLS